MSREDAAVVYIDVLFGLRGDYGQFVRATETLSETDQRSLFEACGNRVTVDSRRLQ